MKKILSLIVVLAMLLTSNLAFAQYEAITGIETDGDSFVVSGQNVSEKDSVITLQVLKSGATWNDLRDFDYAAGDITQYLADFDTISDIGYGEDYSFTKKLVDGNMPAFRIRFGDGSVTYYDPVLMQNINAASSAQELEAIAKADAAVWDEMQSTVEALSTEEQAEFWQILFETKVALSEAGTPFALPAEFSGSAPGVSVLARLNLALNASELKELFADFRSEGMFTGNSYDIYAGEGEFAGFGMSESQKSSFFAYIYSNIDNYAYIEDFTADFNENALFYAIKDGPKEGIDAILSGSDLIDADKISTYLGLSDTKRENVCKKIGTNKRYTSVSSLLADVESAAKAEKRGTSESTGGNGGGSGGGSTSVKEQTPIFVGEEDKAKVEGLPFTDIENVEWAQKAITALADAKIVEGNGAGSFNPNNYVTREEFVKMLVLTLNISTDSANEAFDDIDSSDWCHPYVCAAVSAGIVNGIDSDTFGKGRVISREEMATMTYRALSAMGIFLGGVDKEDFADASSISPWAIESCTAMHRAGIINGMGNNYFAPGEYVTRAQAAKILYEVMSR